MSVTECERWIRPRYMKEGKIELIHYQTERICEQTFPQSHCRKPKKYMPIKKFVEKQLKWLPKIKKKYI